MLIIQRKCKGKTRKKIVRKKGKPQSEMEEMTQERKGKMSIKWPKSHGLEGSSAIAFIRGKLLSLMREASKFLLVLLEIEVTFFGEREISGLKSWWFSELGNGESQGDFSSSISSFKDKLSTASCKISPSFFSIPLASLKRPEKNKGKKETKIRGTPGVNFSKKSTLKVKMGWKQQLRNEGIFGGSVEI